MEIKGFQSQWPKATFWGGEIKGFVSMSVAKGHLWGRRPPKVTQKGVTLEDEEIDRGHFER